MLNKLNFRGLNNYDICLSIILYACRNDKYELIDYCLCDNILKNKELVIFLFSMNSYNCIKYFDISLQYDYDICQMLLLHCCKIKNFDNIIYCKNNDILNSEDSLLYFFNLSYYNIFRYFSPTIRSINELCIDAIIGDIKNIEWCTHKLFFNEYDLVMKLLENNIFCFKYFI